MENISRSVFEECFDAQRDLNDCHRPSLNEEAPGLWGDSRLEDSVDATGHIALNSHSETHMTTSFTEENSALCEDSVHSTNHISSGYRPDMLAHNIHGLSERRDSTGISENTSESISTTGYDANSSDSDSTPATLRTEIEDVPGWRGTDFQAFLSDFVEARTLLVLSVVPAALFRFRRATLENLKRMRTRTTRSASDLYATHTLAILRAFLVLLTGCRAYFYLSVQTHLNALSMPHYWSMIWPGWLSSMWTTLRLLDINFAPRQESYWIILEFLPILHPRFWPTKQCLFALLRKLCNSKWKWHFLLVSLLAITAYCCTETSEDMAFYDLNGEMLPRHIRLQFQPSNTPT